MKTHVQILLIAALSLTQVASFTWAAQKSHSDSNCADSLVTNNASGPATFKGQDGVLYISKEAHVFGGKPVDTNKYRAPIVIERSGQTGASNAQMIVDELLHDGKFHKARISLNPEAIENVYLQTMPFPVVPGVMAGHIQARFVMAAGHEIELVDPLDPTQTKFVKDIIISYEAALPPGGSYNFALGAVDANPFIGRLVSGQQKVAEGPNRQFNQYKLPLDGWESSRLLAYFVNHASSIQMNQYYNTIVRNCTTAIFDGIDSLPRFKQQIESGKLKPFLTTIGGDPVVGPAVDALLERFGSELEHVQDMKEEYKGIFKSYGAPQKVGHKRIPFAPGGDHSMALLALTRGTENLSPQERKTIQSTVDDIVNDLPETINMLMSAAFSVTDDLQKSPLMIQAMTEVIAARLNARMESLKGKLPGSPVSIQIHFTPYPVTSQRTDLRDTGIRAQLPYPIEQIELLPNTEAEVFAKIQKGIQQVDKYAPSGLPAYVKSFAVHIQLHESNSKVGTQILVGLQPLIKEVDIKNEQVNISQLKVPSPEEYSPPTWKRLWNRWNPFSKGQQHRNVSMLLTHEQPLQSQANNTAKIRFGSSPQVITSTQSAGQLTIPRISNNKFLCWAGKQPHTPQLSGTLASTPLGNGGRVKGWLNKFLAKKPITFSVTDLEMNLKEMNLHSTRLRVGVLGLRCLDIESVNKQFGNEANAKLSEIRQKLGDHDVELP